MSSFWEHVFNAAEHFARGSSREPEKPQRSKSGSSLKGKRLKKKAGSSAADSSNASFDGAPADPSCCIAKRE